MMVNGRVSKTTAQGNHSKTVSKYGMAKAMTRDAAPNMSTMATRPRMQLVSPKQPMDLYVPRTHSMDPSPTKSPPHISSQRKQGPSSNFRKLRQKPLEQERAKTHGGLPVSNLFFKDTSDVLIKYKRSAPQLSELGVIDIKALTLSIKSGIHGEIRFALDVMAALSRARPPPLRECEELLDTLIDFTSDQIEMLADGSFKSSDSCQLLSNEAQIRGFTTQSYALQEVPDIGSRTYNLDRAASRLISVMTILRNLSLLPDNRERLREPSVIRLMTTVVRFLGTRDLFLRTHENAVNFNKDMIIFLSAMSPYIDLTAKEEGLAILQFLLSFAPEPWPAIQDERVSFALYVPTMHRYLAHAVDALAKLIARDPNRALYRSIFASESLSSPPFDLLTRAFGLAVSVIPEIADHQGRGQGIIAVRIPIIAQGLLSAEILVGMLPVSAHDIAYSWLCSQDGFSSRLMALLSLISKIPNGGLRRRQDGRPEAASSLDLGYRMIRIRGKEVLRKLTERARDAAAFTTNFSTDVLRLKQGATRTLGPTKES